MNTPRRSVWLVWLTVAALRIGWAVAFAMWIERDPEEDVYDEIAENIAHGHGFVVHAGGAPTLYRPPGYPYLLAAVFTATGFSRTAVYVLQVVFDILTALLVFRLGDRLFGRREAIAAMALYAVYPFNAAYSVRILTEAPFTLLLLAGLVLLAEGMTRRQAAWFAAAGAVLGLATLFRTSILYYVLSLLPAGLAAGLLAGRRRDARALPFAVLVAVAAVALAPWVLRNYEVTGRIPLLGTGNGYNLWLGNHLPTDGRDNDELEGERLATLKRDIAAVTGGDRDAFSVANDRRFRDEALRALRAQPAATAALVVRKAFRFWFEVYYPGYRSRAAALVFIQGLLLAAAVAGAWLARNRWELTWPLAYLVLYLNALHAAVVATFRYCLPVMPIVILFAAPAVAAAAARLGRRDSGVSRRERTATHVAG